MMPALCLEVENKMEMTRSNLNASVALAGIVLAAVFVVSFATVPIAIAASSGSDYQMEIIRAHTAYKVVDPIAAVQVGLGVRGGR